MQKAPTADEDARRAKAIAHEIYPMLAGQESGVQAAVLPDLVSLWVAGRQPDTREQLFAQWIELVRGLVPVQEEIVRRSVSTPGP